jgi:biopolymer transport protein ExbD
VHTLRTLALLFLVVGVFACGGKKQDDPAKEPVTDRLSGLHASADTVLDELVSVESKKDVTCWVSFRQLDWFIAEKPYSEFGTLAKITAMKGLVRATWEKASTAAKGGAVTDADIKAAVKLPDIKLSAQQQTSLTTFANDIGLKNFTDYQKTAEHTRMVLAVIQDEMYSTGGQPKLRPLDPAAVRALTDAATTLSLMMLKESGKAAETAKSTIIEGPHVQAAYKTLIAQLALSNTPHARQPLAQEQIQLHLQPITKKLIDNKVEALLAYNKGTRNPVADLNKVTRIPLTDDGLAAMMMQAQSFVHFVAAGFEPMQSDNFLDDGSYAKSKMARKGYIDEEWAQNVVMNLFPHHMENNGDIDVRFEVNPGPVSNKPLKGFSIKLLDHEMNGVRDSAVHWLAMQNVWKEKPFAMDPFAAEYVSEVVSMMITLWIRRGETIATELGKKQIDAEVVKRIRDRAYVMRPPAEMKFAEWTEERKKIKAEVIASVPAQLFKDTSKTAGLPTKFATWNADLDSMQAHVEPALPGHVEPTKDLKNQPGHVAPDTKNLPGHVEPNKDLKNQPGHVEPDKDLKKQPGHVEPNKDLKDQLGHVEPNSLVVELTADGKYVVGGKTVADDQLDNLFRAAYAKDKGISVVVAPAKGVANGKVVALLERAKRAGLTKLAIKSADTKDMPGHVEPDKDLKKQPGHVQPDTKDLPGHVQPDTKKLPGHVEPDTKNLPGHVEPPKFVVELAVDGKTVVDGKPMTDDALTYAVRGAFATNNNLVVTIMPAKGTPQAQVATLHARIKKLGITKISISDPALRNIPGHVEPEPIPGHVEPSGQGGFNLQTIMGGGIAVGDLDGDEYPDLYLTGEELGKLYLNKGKAAPGTFTDVTTAWGLPKITDGHGTLFFDYDGDGDLDLLVLRSEHASALFRNDKGKFTDIHDELGLLTHRGSHVAHVFDFDRDGDLDIYIGYYGSHASNMSPGTARSVPSLDGRNGSPNQLWRNDGTKFTEIAKQAKVDDVGWCLAVASADIDLDGDLDIFLANDFGADVFYKNNGDGTFSDITESTGTGDRGSGMNAEFGDVNGDGKWDVYVTNIDMFSKNIKVIFPRDESTINVDDKLTKAFQYIAGNKLYVSTKEGGFRPEENLRMEPIDRGWGWDASFFDYENDGDDDLYVTNGWINGSYAGNQKKQMYLNQDGYLYLAPQSSAEAFAGNARSAAAIDLDLDGDIDLVVNSFRQPPRVLINQQVSKNNFVQLRLSTTKGKNPRALGATIQLTANGKPLLRQVSGGRGYLSQADTLVTAGLGKATTVDVVIKWPDGSESKHPGLAANKRHALAQP